MIQKVIIYANSHNETAKRYAQKAAEYLSAQKIECYSYSTATYDIERAQFDVILSFGGDGTILSAAKHYMNYDIPIMGFNVGKLGFLAEFSIKELNENINCLLTRNHKIINRFVLEGKIIEANSTDNISKASNNFLALNDFVLSSEGQTQSRLITLSAYANEQYIGDYWADGVIVATPTGSTAYSLSCGGPIISPDSDVICITPISPHTLTLRPVVLPKNKTISLQLKKQNTTANITADGQKVGTISYNEKFEIKIFNKEVKIIVPNDSNYFDVLRNKLLWAEKIV